jgi:hypothetical protein
MFRLLFHPRNVPKINLLFSSSAIIFQTFFSYPYHNEFNKKLENLNKKIDEIKKN